MITQAIVLIFFPAVMAIAASSDLLTMTISNKIPLALFAGFVALALVLRLDIATIASHIGAAMLILAVCFGMFARGWIGGGDAKLAAAIALWLGWAHLLDYLLVCSVLGGGLTLLLLLFRKFPLPPALLKQEWLDRLHHPKSGIPYGIALAAAALVVFPETPWMRAAGG